MEGAINFTALTFFHVRAVNASEKRDALLIHTADTRSRARAVSRSFADIFQPLPLHLPREQNPLFFINFPGCFSRDLQFFPVNYASRANCDLALPGAFAESARGKYS